MGWGYRIPGITLAALIGWFIVQELRTFREVDEKLYGEEGQALRDGVVRATQPLEADRTFEKAVWITDPDQLIRYARLALLFQDRPDERATALCAWAVKAAGLDPLKHSVAVTNQNARAILVLVYSQDLNTSERERLTRLAVEGPG